MSALFASGRIVDLILGITVLEALVLLALYRRNGSGIAPVDLLGNLASGICLMLALRGALVGAWWGWIGLCLAASLVAHLSDLRRRWR